MLRLLPVGLVFAGLCYAAMQASDDVTVAGITFPTSVERVIGDKSAKLAMTGAGVREKLLLNFYAVASYVKEGDAAKDAEELAAADCPKCLHLVMIRNVSGADMADAFSDAVRLNYPAPALQEELDRLGATIKKKTARKGDHIWLTHLPGLGLQCDFAGQVFVIRNPEFAHAVWNIYLGPKNLGDKLKKSLVSRL